MNDHQKTEINMPSTVMKVKLQDYRGLFKQMLSHIPDSHFVSETILGADNEDQKTATIVYSINGKEKNLSIRISLRCPLVVEEADLQRLYMNIIQDTIREHPDLFVLEIEDQ